VVSVVEAQPQEAVVVDSVLEKKVVSAAIEAQPQEKVVSVVNEVLVLQEENQVLSKEKKELQDALPKAVQTNQQVVLSKLPKTEDQEKAKAFKIVIQASSKNKVA
jgi:hypothetical protein